MSPLLIHPDPPAAVVGVLQRAGYTATVASSAAEERKARPDAGWAAALLVVSANSVEGVVAMVATLRADTPETPILWLVDPSGLPSLDEHPDGFDDFCLLPLRDDELVVRIAALLRTSDAADGDHDDLIAYGPLQINPVTYQAMIDGAPLDLTYMEYELLKYFAQRPGRVCTREVLLAQVWGYDYYGGARTVDVHVRRLRAKLGETHAGLIATVRSVGYRFGTSKWG